MVWRLDIEDLVPLMNVRPGLKVRPRLSIATTAFHVIIRRLTYENLMSRLMSRHLPNGGVSLGRHSPSGGGASGGMHLPLPVRPPCGAQRQMLAADQRSHVQRHRRALCGRLSAAVSVVGGQ